MPLFYLLFVVLFSLGGCQPAEVAPPASLTLFKDNNILLQLSPASAPVETPLQLQLSATGLAKVSAELTGVSMYMGRVPLRFTQQGEVWQAEFLLGACSDPKMQWQLQLELEFVDGKKRTVKQQFYSSWR